MSGEVFQDDDGHGDCFTEEQVKEHEDATERKTSARVIAWLEALEVDGIDGKTVLERLRRGDWRTVAACDTCECAIGIAGGLCEVFNGGPHGRAEP